MTPEQVQETLKSLLEKGYVRQVKVDGQDKYELTEQGHLVALEEKCSPKG